MSLEASYYLWHLHVQLQSAVPEKIHPHSMEDHQIPKGRGVLEVKILEAKYEAKLEFPGGRGVQKKKPLVGEVWIFSGSAQ